MRAQPRIALIYARADNGVIGREGTMPWHLPEDLARFRALTQGHPVVMGRKTWDSLPARFRPLPGRRNIVLTRQQSWQAPGAERGLFEVSQILRQVPRQGVVLANHAIARARKNQIQSHGITRPRGL